MTTFSEKSYNFENYLKFRPTYPLSLFQCLQDYIGEPVTEAVDLACGTGQAAKEIAKFAKHVTGIDPSAGMIQQAPKLPNVDYMVGSDATITELIPPHSVDLVTIAEALHWIDFPTSWSRIHQILKPGGVFAAFSYYLFTFVDHPESGPIIADFFLGEDKCAPYWDKGQRQLNDLYAEIKVPTQYFSDEVRVINSKDQLAHDHPFEIIKYDVPVRHMINMMATCSGYHNWRKANPGKPDIVAETEKRLLAATKLSLDSKVTVKYESVYIFAKAK